MVGCCHADTGECLTLVMQTSLTLAVYLMVPLPKLSAALNISQNLQHAADHFPSALRTITDVNLQPVGFAYTGFCCCTQAIPSMLKSGKVSTPTQGCLPWGRNSQPAKGPGVLAVDHDGYKLNSSAFPGHKPRLLLAEVHTLQYRHSTAMCNTAAMD